jgi:ribosomal protein S18 acetylase RimI-like enzyme
MRVQQLGGEDHGEVARAAHLFDEPNDPIATRAYLGDKRNVFFLAYEGSEPIGFLRGTAFGQLKSERKQMFLYEVAVEMGRRRAGVGSALIHSLIRYCKDRNFEEIFVFTDDPSNSAAERLYLSTGGINETVGDRMYVYRL